MPLAQGHLAFPLRLTCSAGVRPCDLGHEAACAATVGTAKPAEYRRETFCMFSVAAPLNLDIVVHIYNMSGQHPSAAYKEARKRFTVLC